MPQGHGSKVEDILYWSMVLLGVAVIMLAIQPVLWGAVVSLLYMAYGYAGIAMMTRFVCRYCSNESCPSRQKASRRYGKGDPSMFAGKFKRYIPAIVPLWVIPALAGAVGLWLAFGWLLLAFLLLFVIISYVLLPALSKKYTCSHCPQQKRCPWMGGK